MSDKAMRKAAEALDGHPDLLMWSQDGEWFYDGPLAPFVAAYLDGLLADLPEEAVEAAEERFSARLPVSVEYVHIDSRRNIASEAIRAALRSLRGSLPAGTRGDGDA